MKVLEFNYKTSPDMRKLVFERDEDGNKLLNDIVKARNDKVETILVNGNGHTMMINPCEILELVLKETKGFGEE